jgi:hypothetical protein
MRTALLPRIPLLAVALMSLCPNAHAVADRVVTLEGRVIEGPLTALHAETGVAIGEARIDFEGVRNILPARPPLPSVPPEATVGQAEIMLVCGSTVTATDVRLTGEEFTADVANIGTLVFPIDVVRAVRYGTKEIGSRYEKALRELDDTRDTDTFFFRQMGELLEADGLVEHISGNVVRYEAVRDKKPVVDQAPVEDIYGFVLASPLEIEAEKRPYRVSVEGGSQLHADWVALDGSVLRVRIIGGQEVTVPWEKVRGLVVHSSRLEFLSDLSPVREIAQAILAPPRQWQRDLGVVGGALVAGGQEFEKGLGVAAGTSLTFASDGYSLFVASIALDASSRGMGDCEFVVRADGVEKFRRRVRGDEPAEVIRVELDDAITLELSVEPGANLDLADHADWGDACLVKEK